MNQVEKFAVDLAVELAAAVAAGPARVSVDTHAKAIEDHVQDELAAMKWRRQTEMADGAVASANAERLSSTLDEIAGKIHGAVEVGDEDYATALMEREDAVRDELAAAQRQAETHQAAAAELGYYVSALTTFQRETKAELATVVAKARVAESTAAMAASYQSIENLRTSIDSLRDNVVRAHAYATGEAEQAAAGSSDLRVRLLAERGRADRYRGRIERIRRGEE
jgi:phage shock protein A